MEINFDLFSIIITLGIIQGIFLSFIFFRIKKGNKKANYVLAFLLFIISVSICSSVLLFTNLYRYVPHFIRIEVILLFMFPPVLFLYVKVLTIHDYKYSVRELLHFIPAAAALIVLSPFFISSAQNKIAYYQGILSGNVDYLDMVLIMVLNFLEWFYVIKILKLVKTHQDNIKQNYSNIDEINLSWIRVFTIAFIFVALCAHIFSVLVLAFNYPYSMFYRFLPVAVTGSIFYLGYKGLMQQEIFTTLHTGVGRKASLKESKYEKYYKRIVQAVEDRKLYIDPELTISDMEKKFSLTREIIAKVILTCSGKIFYDFLNNFRVKEAKRYLMDRKNSLSMAAVAIRSGFKSESDLNSIFEKHTRLTPSQFKIEYHSHKTAKSKKTIAIFLASLYDTFEELILYGVNKLAREQNLNLLCFNGGNFNAPIYNYSQKTKIFDLVSSYSLDGIIMISVLLGAFISKKELIEFYHRFSSIPMVSIGMDVEGMPGIWVDDKRGVRDLLIHLIEVHGYRRIAYINGPEQNIDAMQRYQIYKDVLSKYNIPYDPDLVAPGDFMGVAGKQAVRLFLDQRKVHVDAIFAANDYMALHAIQELHDRGIRVPEDIAVVGFDDIVESRYLMSPLTTVTQPTFELGYQAAKKLLGLINNDYVEQKTVLQTGLIIRNSCGCKTAVKDREAYINKMLKEKKTSADENAVKTELIPKVTDLMCSAYGNLVNPAQISEWTVRLCDALREEIKIDGRKEFSSILKNIIVDAYPIRIDFSFWNAVIELIFGHFIKSMESGKKVGYLKQVWENAVELITFIEGKNKEYPAFGKYEQSMILFLIQQALLTICDKSGLKKILTQDLPKLGIKSCYLSIYETSGAHKKNQFSRCLLAYKDYKVLDIADDDELFFSEDLIPGGIANTVSNDPFILMSLYYQNQSLGFIIYQVDNIDITIFELLTMTLSSALNSVLLHEQLQSQGESIHENIGKADLHKYEKAGLSEEKSEQYFKVLIDFMEQEKIYKDPDLTLPLLAEELTISRNHLSYIINKYAGLNFYDFINSYRVEEAKKHLTGYQCITSNILEIAFEAGFKSKSTFNKIFKKYTHKTPSEFKKIYADESVITQA